MNLLVLSFQTFSLQNRKLINLYCFKLSSCGTLLKPSEKTATVIFMLINFIQNPSICSK